MRVRVRDCLQRNGSTEETCYSTAETRRHRVRDSPAAHPHSPACWIHDRIYRTETPLVPGAGCCLWLRFRSMHVYIIIIVVVIEQKFYF